MSAKVQYIWSIKSSYTEGVDQKQRAKDKSDIVALHLKKLERSLLLGHQLDAKVQLYLRNGGGAVPARIAMAGSWGICLKCDQSKLGKFRGHVELN